MMIKFMGVMLLGAISVFLAVFAIGLGVYVGGLVF
jgi:hypothetical protein